MCGIVPFFRGLYEDLMEAIDDLFPNRAVDSAPLINNNRQYFQPQVNQQGYTSAARPVSERENLRRVTERLEVRAAAARMPDPSRGPPTK
ncbi:hypothetical protein F53441_3178 [Fusarium austroafricanum]|uniref:Uncharacterized protein n=1 Tax=Fusarium austroafricanum TaxID=2364996 RepID=A0A8H4KR15_9HYPO|nr:hypothetical protein F53441_3178 [Fusarium austroafricanum]